MRPRIQLNDREFIRALRVMSRTTSKELPDFLNHQAKELAFAALHHTRKADLSKIEAQLSKVSIATHSKRGKAYKKAKRTSRPTRLVTRLVNARRIRAGDKPLQGAELKKAATDYLNRVKRSIGYIKSGWIPAINKLKAAVKKGKPARYQSSVKGIKQWGKPQGGVKVARRATWSTFVLLWNETTEKALGKLSWRAGNPEKYGLAGLRAGMAERRADIIKVLKDRLGPAFKKFNLS